MSGRGDKALGFGGLAFSGVTAYAFLAVAGRALGAELFAPLGTLWAVVFLATAALAAPLELVVSRTVAAARARGAAPWATAVSGAALAAAMAVSVDAVAVVAGRSLDASLFSGQNGFSWIASAAFAGLVLGAVAKGVCTGRDQLGGWGAYLAADASSRLLLSGVAWVVMPTPTGFALAVALGPWLALLPVGIWLRPLLSDRRAGPTLPAAIGLARNAAPLVGAAAAAAALTYLGPVLLSLLAPPPSPRLGATIAALSLARVPLFALSPLVAVVVPRIAFAAASHDPAAASRGAVALVGAAMVGGAAIVIGAAAAGAALLELAFGSGFWMPAASLEAIAVAAAGWLVATAATAVPIALGEGRLAALAWSAGLAVAGVTAVAAGPDPYDRTDWALVLGAVLAAALGLAAAGLVVRAALPQRSARVLA